MPLIINGFIKLNDTLGVIFTPTNEGILTAILFGVAGLDAVSTSNEKEIIDRMNRQQIDTQRYREILP